MKKIKFLIPALILLFSGLINIHAKGDDFDIDAFGTAVRSQYLEINEKVLTNKLKGIELSLYSQIYQRWAEHPYIEKAVRIQRFWFSGLSKRMKEMSGYKTQMEVYGERGKKELYQTAKEKYVKLLKKFKEYAEKPPKLERTRSRRKS